jgi:hypothetical protein
MTIFLAMKLKIWVEENCGFQLINFKFRREK